LKTISSQKKQVENGKEYKAIGPTRCLVSQFINPFVKLYSLYFVCPGYDIKLDPAVLPMLTSFGGFVAGRAFGRKNFLSLFTFQCVNNGGERCGVRRVRPVGDDAWRDCCWLHRPTRARMEKLTLNCMID